MEYITFMKNRIVKAVVLIGFGLVVVGCETTKPLFYWGSYESLIYDSYHKPDRASPEIQIQKLRGDVERAEKKGYKVAPGIYAHLGFMYAAMGNKTAAEASFNLEKTLYPESAVLLDGMIKRAKEQSEK